jgi:hypothetical protein
MPPPTRYIRHRDRETGQQKREAKGRVEIWIIRLEAQCPAKAGLGFARTLEMKEFVPEIVMSGRVLRLEAHRHADACLGFLETPEIVEHTSEIVVCVGKVRLQAQCLA